MDQDRIDYIVEELEQYLPTSAQVLLQELMEGLRKTPVVNQINPKYMYPKHHHSAFHNDMKRDWGYTPDGFEALAKEYQKKTIKKL